MIADIIVRRWRYYSTGQTVCQYFFSDLLMLSLPQSGGVSPAKRGGLPGREAAEAELADKIAGNLHHRLGKAENGLAVAESSGPFLPGGR